MNTIKFNIKSILNKVKNSIAFYPTIIAAIIIMIGSALIIVDQKGWTTNIDKLLPLIVVNDIDTARSILIVLIGALISLMVFSFSMVMVVLNQAANNFSPRLLPGLIANKEHQIVLGFYLGSIINSIISLLRMEPSTYHNSFPSIGVIYSIILGVSCLGLFIFFIHSISQSIQISKIIYKVYKKTLTQIQNFNSNRNIKLISEKDIKWYPIALELTGYVKDFELSKLAAYSLKNDIKIKTGVTEGAFISNHTVSFYTSIEETKKLKEDLTNYILVDDEEWITEHPNLGVKQIVEIILKAMSPGINDPGTAITGLDYLSSIYKERQKLRTFNCYVSEDGGQVFLTTLSFEEILAFSFAAIRQYVRHDIVIMSKLLNILFYLKTGENDYEEPLFQGAIKKQAEILLEDANKHIENTADLKYFIELFKDYQFN